MSDETLVSEPSPPVTSTVTITETPIGFITVRSYSDGAVQKNIWESLEVAQEYADSVHAQEGTV